MDAKKLRLTALLAAKRAAKILLSYYGKKGSVSQKPNKSLVSEADLKANKVIIDTINKKFPNHSILSEETGFYEKKSGYRWIIDPLDGTHNFLHGIPIFGTSIALEYENEVVFGLLHFPVLKITAIAEKNKGAFLNGKKLRVSKKGNLKHLFIALEFSYTSRKRGIDFLKKMVNKTIDIRDFGCAIYDLLLVASGKCDGFVILSTNSWDVAAGFLMVEEAGGKITNLDGGKWNLAQCRYLVSNGRVHKELLKHAK